MLFGVVHFKEFVCVVLVSEVGSNELHLLESIFWVTNTFRVYFKMGTFTLTQVHF